MNVAECLVQYLEDEGVKAVFGVPGEENLHLLQAIHNSSIEMIVTRHEAGAAFMAAMLGRLTGTPGVCLSTLGPGATNLLAGVANANMDHSPLVAITAQGGMNRQHKESHQIYDLIQLFKPITKWNASILTPEITGEVVRKAFHIARAEKPGATQIQLPEDVASMEMPEQPFMPAFPHRHIQATQQELNQAATLIQQAKHPLLLCGNGVAREKAQTAVQGLAERIQLPVTETFMGKGSLGSDHPLLLLPAGMPGRDWTDLAMEFTDLIITVGFDIVEYRPDRWNKKQIPILHIDTQPAEIDQHYPVQTSLIGDLHENISQLVPLLEQRDALPIYYARLKQSMDDEFTSDRDSAFPMKPQQIVADLKSVLNPRDIVCTDVGAHKMWMGRLFPTDHPHTCLISNGLAAMGFALPSAIGAKLAFPDRNVVAVVGDGSYEMTGMELETAIRLQLPIVILLWRDGGYGLIEWKQLDELGESAYVKFGNPDFIMQAQSYGAEAFRIEQADQLIPMLQKALTLQKPVLIDCPVDYHENIKLSARLEQVDIMEESIH